MIKKISDLSNAKKNTLFIVFIIFSVFLFVSKHSRDSFLRGQEALQVKNYSKAINAFGESIRWYYPLNPWVKKSVQQLMRIGETQQKKQNYDLAAQAYLEVRHALSSMRGFYFPMFDEAQKSSEKYIDLQITSSQNLNTHAGLERLTHEYSLTASRKLLSLVVFSAFFILWLVSTWTFIFKSFDREGNLINKKIIYSWLPISFFSFGVWVWMLNIL